MTAHEAILTAIRTAFGDRAAGVQLAPMAGGKSGAQLFAFAIDGAEYVVRKTGFVPPGDPTKSERELACIRIAAELGVAPRLVHGDASRGVSIMEKVAGMSDPFLDLGQLGVWVCRDANERAHLLASYLERAPGPDEVTRAGRCRVLALGFYAAAFHLVSLFTGRTVVPTDEDNALEAVFARMARTGQPFAAEEMAAAMVAEMTREVQALG